MLRVYQPEQEVNTSLNTSGNPDNNSWTAGFTYDADGNVLTTTDAKGTTITNTYDALNRSLTRTYSDGTPTVTNYYDGTGLSSTPNYSKGKLTRVASSISDSRYTSFDIIGKLLEYQQITDGNTYTSSYEYNLSGALTQETYPSGRTVTHEYDASGNIARIEGKAGPSAIVRPFATAFSYLPDGKIEKLRLGNGLYESANVNSRLQVTELALGHSVGDGGLMKIDYDYGEFQTGGTVDVTKNAGNIAKQTISFNGLANPFVQTYKYDSLDRVTEAKESVNGDQSWKQTFDYDRYGNRTAFSQIIGSTTLTVDSTVLPAVDAASNRYSTGQGVGYDKNGNITADAQNGGRTFVFNGDNKQTEVKDANNITIGTYSYDGTGKRVKKVTDLETTVFVYDGLGKLVAEYSNATPPSNPTTNYTATDTIGSPRVLTNALGEIVSRRDFMPFGEELYADGINRTTSGKYSTSSQDAVRQRFTGYERDLETGLDFAEARYYDNQHGRFTAVDPLLASGKSANPQTFNRYTYALDRPLLLVDQTGLQSGKKAPPERYDGPMYMDNTGKNFSEIQTGEYSARLDRTTYAARGGKNYVVSPDGYVQMKIPHPSQEDIDFAVSTAKVEAATKVATALAVSMAMDIVNPVGRLAEKAGIDLHDPNVQMAAIASTGGLAGPEVVETEALDAVIGDEGFNLALGVRYGLEDFAAETDSVTYDTLTNGAPFHPILFGRIAEDADQINFNTVGFDQDAFELYQQTGASGYETNFTNYELDTILNDPELLEKTEFHP